MILAAAFLVLGALGLFVWGVLTGATGLFWACVGVSAVAAVLLIIARRRLGREGAGQAAAPVRWDGADAVAARDPHAEPVVPREAEPVAPPPTPEPPGPPPMDWTPPAGHGVPAEEPFPTGPVADGGLPSRHASREDQRRDRPPATAARPPAGDPPVEEVEVTDLLLVVDLTDEVLVVDEHPRYHLAGCPHLAGHDPIPLPLDEARTDVFTPCASCAPDRHLAERERSRRARHRGQ